MKKIAVVGTGYVGLSNAILLAQHNEVIAVETSVALKMNSIAYDFVYDENNNPLILEISYAFSDRFDSNIPGYWDEQRQWHEEKLENIPF